MNWYKRANDKYREFVDDVVENMQWMINTGEIENIYDLTNRIKTDYSADIPERIFEAIYNEVCERLKNELV